MASAHRLPLRLIPAPLQSTRLKQGAALIRELRTARQGPVRSPQGVQSGAMILAAKEEMHVFPLAACVPSELTENSYQGHRPSRAVMHQALAYSKPLHAPGLPTCLYDKGIRSRCTGKERDAESGLDYFGARYFSGAQGRFTSADAPFADQHAEDPQSWNLYGYVRNNPLKNTDPNGTDCQNGVSACANYILGGVGAIANAFTSGAVNLPNRTLDAVAGLVNGGHRVFGDVVPDLFTPANAEQKQGADSMNAVLPFAGAIEAVGAAATVDAVGASAAAESGAASGTAPKIGEAGGPGAGKPFPNSVKDAARAESSDTCVFCGQPTTRTAGPDQSNIDHAIPKSREGNNTLNNAQNTCRTCNLDKHTQTTQEYQQKLRQKQQQDNQ
jgi:RHS repeat-associated protein